MTPVQQASLFLAAARWCALVGFESTGIVQEREEAYQVLRRIVLEIEQGEVPPEVLEHRVWVAAMAQQGPFPPTSVSAPAEMGSPKRNR